MADDIYAYFKNKSNVELYRDVFDIRKWGSIKEYMQSISDMDYIILLISDSYLKSANCMYEVLEVMRDRNYRDKIFPAIISHEIYKPINRAKYVKYWETEFKKLEEELEGISVQNLGKLGEDLKQCQDISSNMAEFLEVVSDMNNPMIQDVTLSIEEKLQEKGLLNGRIKRTVDEKDLFATLGIQKKRFVTEPSGLEISQFMKDSFENIVSLFSELCSQYEKENSSVNISVERIDTRTVVFHFYRNGTMIRGLKLFLNNMFGMHDSIGLADVTMSWGNNNNSWNGMYDAKFSEGELKLRATMSMENRDKLMTNQEVVADIWINYIRMYLER